MRKSDWFAVLGIAALWFVTRALWGDCDPGVPSMWEYGYNATDEGYYLVGGKEKFVRGLFVDLARGESQNYGFSPLTHWLSYLAHLLFGLSTWTWRIPFFVLNLLSWCCLTAFISRRVGAFSSFMLCAALSLVPMVVAYERTASNDVLIGSLLVISSLLAFSRSKACLVFSALATASIALVKPSVWVLVPIVFACVMSVPKTSSRLRDAALFFGILALAIFSFKGCVVLSVLKDAGVNSCTASEAVRRLTNHYPLPSLFAFFDHFRGLSSFPRDPSSSMLSFLSVLLVPVPLFFALCAALRKNLKWRHFLYMALPLYVAGVSVMNTLYTHYFIPALAVLPLLWVFMREDMEELSVDCSEKVKAPVFVFFCAAVVALPILAWLLLNPSPLTSSSALQAVQSVYSRVYNFPAAIVWKHTFAGALALAAATTLLAFVSSAFSAKKGLLLAVALSSLVAGSVIMAFLPAAELAPYMRKAPNVFLAPAAVSFAVFLIVVVGAFSFPAVFAKKKVWFSLPFLFVASSALMTPLWRESAVELSTLRSHYHRDAAKVIAKLVPENAVVIGERSNQMLMALPTRTASTFAFNSDPMPIVKALWKREPATPLYALVDTQHSYNLKHYRENAALCDLEVVHKFVMPSFASGAPADVYLCKISRKQEKKEK